MASPHRKLFPPEQPQQNSTSTPFSPSPSIPTVQTCIYYCHSLRNDTVSEFCPAVCLAICPSVCKYPDLISPPSQPTTSHNLSPLLISMLIVLVFLFLLITFYVLYTKLHPRLYPVHNTNNPTPQTRPSPRRIRSRRRNDSLDEEHGRTVVFHPIWYIPTVGLNPSVISSIAVHTYGGKRSERDGVDVDGTDCAVCLAEFQEGDELKVLPKCNHAFHIPCIDTWLRSHTNCPLCRAPVVVPPDQTDGNSSPPLEGVPAATEDHHHQAGDDHQQVLRINTILIRSASMDGSIENKEIKNNKGGGSSSSRSDRWSLERGPAGLAGRSSSCSAKIFSSRYHHHHNDRRPDPNS